MNCTVFNILNLIKFKRMNYLVYELYLNKAAKHTHTHKVSLLLCFLQNLLCQAFPNHLVMLSSNKPSPPRFSSLLLHCIHNYQISYTTYLVSYPSGILYPSIQNNHSIDGWMDNDGKYYLPSQLNGKVLSRREEIQDQDSEPWAKSLNLLRPISL